MPGTIPILSQFGWTYMNTWRVLRSSAQIVLYLQTWRLLGAPMDIVIIRGLNHRAKP
jgi:hypothetical protein